MSSSMIWIVMIAVMVLSMIIQARLKGRFEKYSEVPTGLSGAEVAQRMLQAHGIHDVNIVSIEGTLTDHYNPQTKTVNLSHDVYYGRNVAAAAVAAHECGHVVQHATGYGPLKLRTAMVPVLTFTNSWISWVLLAGLFLYQAFPSLLWIAIGMFALSTLFSFVTLPVEVNASARAVQWLDNAGVVSIFLADGFEDMEAIATRDVLLRGGVDVQTVSINEDPFVTSSHGITVSVDLTRDDFNDDCPAVMIFPGGMPGSKNLAADKALMALMRKCYAAGGVVAAICAAPGLVASQLDDVEGKCFTCFEGFQDPMIAKGAIYTPESAVVDGKLVTGRGAGHAVNFGLALVELLKGKETADRVRAGLML